MFNLICKHCGVPLEYYKNKESVYGCRVNIKNEYAKTVGRHEYELEIFSIFRKLMCHSVKSFE